MSAKKLPDPLPCPFCGGPGAVQQNIDIWEAVCEDSESSDERSERSWPCTGMRLIGETEKEVTAAWNRRATAPDDRLRATPEGPTVETLIAKLFDEMPGAGYVVLSCLRLGSLYGVSVAHEGDNRKAEGPNLRAALLAALASTTTGDKL